MPIYTATFEKTTTETCEFEFTAANEQEAESISDRIEQKLDYPETYVPHVLGLLIEQQAHWELESEYYELTGLLETGE